MFREISQHANFCHRTTMHGVIAVAVCKFLDNENRWVSRCRTNEVIPGPGPWRQYANYFTKGKHRSNGFATVECSLTFDICKFSPLKLRTQVQVAHKSAAPIAMYHLCP